MAETMLVDGLGTIVGACFGSYYSTTVYIGHPIHKALGARRGFSVFNGILYFILHFVGMYQNFRLVQFPSSYFHPILLHSLSS